MENGSNGAAEYALNEPLAVADPEVHAILRAEKHRQGLITSSHFIPFDTVLLG